jgi:hypothetical protein
MTLSRLDLLVAVAILSAGAIRTGAQSSPPRASPTVASPSPAALTSLITTYAAAWGEPDREARQKLLEAVFAADGTYTDPTVDLASRTALVDHIGQFLERFPGAKIEPTSLVDAHHGSLRFAWRLTLPDGTVAVEGLDFGELSPAGQIRRIVGFFGPLTPGK